ncbi:hypothetical protein OsI_11999 [Oryza sativa Indica Group]|uniref:Myb/SANT-like domain-containing protein n=1 Tax=Oryza sativa subsp. indica TaxID=39946 RepID=B8AJQ3_ORYSI|nr:hypothetical protein OsI_11999 [Oryza sativa Indica Group]
MASYGGGYNGDEGGNGHDDDVYGHDGCTKDFLASGPWCARQGGAVGADAAHPPPDSSSGNTSRVRFESLDLNDSDRWPEMAMYAGMLQADDDNIEIPPPPVRVPPRVGGGGVQGAAAGGGRAGAASAGGGVAGAVVGGGGAAVGGGGAAVSARPASRASVRRNVSDLAAEHSDANDGIPVRKDKANWSARNTRTFCSIWCHQMDIGNYVRGIMQKNGWRDIIKRYFQATGLVHDREQFMGRHRQLRKQWAFCNKLRSSSGLGRNPDGTFVAEDDWWAANTKGHPDWKKFRKGLPEYLPEMDRMFEGVAVDGSISFVATADQPVECDSSDEADDDEDDDELTPLSVGNKRTSSTSTTASSPSKKSRSPADDDQSGYVEDDDQSGYEESHRRLKRWEDEIDELIIALMDDDDDGYVYGMYRYAIHIDKHLTRAEYTTCHDWFGMGT